ncbi:MAG: 30S ribosomal protein S8 [Chitinophagales bacterium]|nr:30S ribosomal protein S8 [Chitinophagales bacterium]
MNTDPIADFLTRIRNAQLAGHRIVEIPSSTIKKRITEILYEQGYLYRYVFNDDDGPQGMIKIALKYNNDNIPVIRKLRRISKPGLRIFKSVDDLPRVLNGLGVAIISTSKGVMTDKDARNNNVGGEVICEVY